MLKNIQNSNPLLLCKRLLVAMFPLLASVLFLAGCHPQLIEINLPDYPRQLVVEGYLEAGKPPSVLLTESVSYFDDPGLPVIRNATMVLTYANVTDTLFFNPFTFRYESPDTLPYLLNSPFRLTVSDSTGRSVKAETEFLPVTRIDSLYSTFDDQYQARMIVKFRDSINTDDYYRITMYAIVEDKSRDVQQNDNLFGGEEAAYSTSNLWNLGDTVLVSLFHIGQDWYDFLVSVDKARVGATNPLVEPASVISNIEGGKGIFTTVNVDHKIIVIQR